jgi:holin-like protein
MRLMKQLAIILGFGFAGEILSLYLPLGMPASVLGLLLMLAALCLKILKPEHLGETAEFLSANMAFFFLPAAVTILDNFDVFRQVLLPFIVICLAGMFVTFAVTYATVYFIRVLMARTGRGAEPAGSR